MPATVEGLYKLMMKSIIGSRIRIQVECFDQRFALSVRIRKELTVSGAVRGAVVASAARRYSQLENYEKPFS